MGVADEIQTKLDECYVAMKVNEKIGLYRPDTSGMYFCHGLATALAIAKGTDAVGEWHAANERFVPESEAFQRQEARMREVLGK